ncbi:hypothetical protein NUW58_g6829 [Xylaria curta]|uniref:Uncharacterized protein n=1 Tax=Xylaria curta TaxID=42375 RepID=A0ACC1NPV3_9PEZI|nr:hypothetical protein NUW58_g6829 [Xylaria curta]
MVKHQRRSHQKGMHLSEIDDCSSESDGGESPTTPPHRAVSWTPLSQLPQALPGHPSHRSTSFADFGHNLEEYGIQTQYGHRQSISAGDAHEYQDTSVPEQHGSIQLLNRMQIPANTYYVTEQSNPAVATMNTNPIQQYQGSRVQERPSQEIPCSATNLNGSIQSVPGAFSSPPSLTRRLLPAPSDGAPNYGPASTAYAGNAASIANLGRT